MHRHAAKIYQQRDTMFKLPTIVLSTISGTSIISTLSNYNSTISIIAGTISLLAAVTSSVHSYNNYQSLSETHNHTSKEYARILDIIHNGIDNKQQIVEEYNRLLQQSPPLPPCSIKALKHFVKKYDLTLDNEEDLELEIGFLHNNENEKYSIEIV